MKLDKIKKFLDEMPAKYKHASIMKRKLYNKDNLQFLISCFKNYKKYSRDFGSDLDKFVDEWNKYVKFIRKNNKKKDGKPIYTFQTKFESTILEESICRIFSCFEDEVIKVGGIEAYLNMYFCNTDYKNFKKNTLAKINTKNQDFAIYKKIEMTIDNNDNKIETFIPVVAIECKTYLDKTMLEGSIATAEKIKNGNPYCRFCIVTEDYEVTSDVDVSNSRIDEIYVLTKKNKDFCIDKNVVKTIFKETKLHLKKQWFDVSNNIKNCGKVINRN